MKHLLTDEELIHQYLSVQPSYCLALLYERYSDKVYRHCLLMTHDEEKARDFTHDIFLRIFDKLASFQQRSRFSTWLFAITRNYCLDQIRQAQRMLMTTLDERFDGHTTECKESMNYEETMQRFAQALARLSVKEQNLLQLKYEQGMTMRELAVLYDLNVDVVKMRLKRGREKVQRFYSLQSV